MAELMMNQMPQASIIIPTWNGRAFIEDCLNSLLSQDYPDFEVIVVDNASTDGTADFVAEKYPTVRLIRNERNLGFSGGVNIGLAQAAGEILVLLNQDTLVEPTWLKELIQGMLTDDKIGIGGCKILDWSGEKIWHTGVVLDEERKFPILRGAGEIDQGQYEQPEAMPAVVGAAFAIRRELLETIGFLNEDYFFYLEDTDYCLRAREAGYKVMYNPRAVLRHYVGASLKNGSYRALYQFNFSRMLFLIKHFGPDWFCRIFVPAEKEYLKKPISLDEFKAHRHVFMNTSIQIAQGDPRYTSHLDTTSQRDMLRALADLRDSSLDILYNRSDWLHGAFGWDRADAWQLKAFEFESSMPVIGPLLTGIRRLWSSIAAKWIERNLIIQQNDVNNHQMILISTLISDIAMLNDQLIELSSRNANISDIK
jgi:GT2 family glycosyltransferase